MKQTITSEEIEWYQQNTDSRPDKQDDDYTQYEGYYTIKIIEHDVLITVARPFVTTMNEVVKAITTCPGENFKLEALSNQNDLDQFWSFKHWQVEPMAELYGVKSYWQHPYNCTDFFDFKCCMQKQLFEQVAHGFPEEIEAGGLVSYEAMVNHLLLAQTTYNRNKKIDNLLALHSEGPVQSRTSSDG